MHIQRVFLELIYLLSIICIIFLYLRMFKEVVFLRRKYKISIGHNNNEELQRAIRAHANFCEYVPFGLLLSMILYFHNFLIFSCISVIFLMVGRIYHHKGIKNIFEKDENFKYRRLGMRFTFLSYTNSIVGIVVYLIQMLYFFYNTKI